MAVNSIFDMRSPEERKKDDEAYYRRMFPFGERQKEYDQHLLEIGVPHQDQKENLYFLLLAKEAVPEGKEALGRWYNDRLLKRFNESEKAFILALAELEKAAGSFEDLPSFEEVRDHAKTVEKEVLPTLPKPKKKGFWQKLFG